KSTYTRVRKSGATSWVWFLRETWEWQPKTDTVTYEGKDKQGKPMKVTYQRSQLDSQSDMVRNEIDPAFVNDQYWLFLPLHLAWDGATVTTPLTQPRERKVGGA